MTSLLFNERRLAHLPTVTDPQAMAERFATHLRKAAIEANVERCAVEEVDYRPGRNCRVLYRLRFCNGSRKPGEQWLLGNVYPAEAAEQRHQEALIQLNRGSSRRRRGKKQKPPVFSPVSFWQELNMVMWAFPFDPELPGLSRLAAPNFIRQKTAAHLADFGLGAEWRCEGFEVDRVKYQPGRRCVLRHEARFNGPSGESRNVTFYSKTYNTTGSRDYFATLCSAHARLNQSSAMLRVPRPILHLDEANTILQEEWKGQALLEALEKHDWETLVPAVATAAADLHKSGISGLRPGPTLDSAMKAAGDEAMNLLESMPHMQHMITTMLLSLEEAKMSLDEQTPVRVPAHGAMRLENILARGGELAMLNFETLALGDPLFDIGEFVASLHFLELSHGKSRARLAAAGKSFCESYAAQVPWPCDRRRLAWYVLAFWIGKMFGACKNLDARTLPQLETAGWEIAKQWLEEL